MTPVGLILLIILILLLCGAISPAGRNYGGYYPGGLVGLLLIILLVLLILGAVPWHW